jgi:aldehyde dehydrogenase (NAD+)
VGKIIAKAAAEHLTPTTLEFRVKSVHYWRTRLLKIGCKRIYGEISKCWQTCVAPDYILVHKAVKSKLIEYLKKENNVSYGDNPETSNDFARIVNLKIGNDVKA